MRLASYRRKGVTDYGVVVQGGVVACGSRIRGDGPDLRTALANGLLGQLKDIATTRSPDFDLDEVELLPPIPEPGKILCVGLNYMAHRSEAGGKPSRGPAIFTRFPDSFVGHEHPIYEPKVTSKLDYEGEVAVVIGHRARRVTAEEGLQTLAGYSCFNDLSVRDWQSHNSQWTPGKNFVGVGSFGPWITTADEIDGAALTLTTRVNGDARQEATTEDMIFPIGELVSYISNFTVLLPGDVIVTGTPGGVGLFRDPPTFLQPGDVVEVDISRVGVLRNEIVPEGIRGGK